MPHEERRLPDLSFQYDGEAVLQEYLEGIFIQVVQCSIFHYGFIRGETATFGHHLRQFGIVKHLALVSTVLYPDYAFIVVVRLVVPLFDCGYHHAAVFHLSRVNIEQDAWNDISEAILPSMLVVSCTSAYDKGLNSPVLSLMPITS